ncbi:TRAP transporter large permease [Desulfoferrobacter suflitae]|uniref:TRAP transporter large permease n=1 Tax=Desulfoferrobacter suflitae TaxID=2865782 RepID=UPI0021646BC5|nr:TRAP transporter large permease [Desulfoferrobacter suflitae]MCK8601190.1 TRAP transporter large permease [Desulfoferrobacter suflitae]
MTTFILFSTLFVLFVINMPIALAIGLASLVTLLFLGDFSLMMVIQRLYAGTDSFPLMAVPLFMFAGALMEHGGISSRIVRLAECLVGWMPGGLAAVSIVSAMFFAGISGSAAADTAAVGAILIPSMIKRGYEPGFAGAVQAAGGSTGVIIPPSIPMIIFGFLTGASVGKLFAAGILPGLLIGISLIAVSTILSAKNKYGKIESFSLRRLKGSLWEAKWALGAPVVILGGILGGIFTATESAAAATLYALAVGLMVHRQLSLRELPNIFVRASITSSVILFIIATASVFSWIMAIEDIPGRIAANFLTLSDNPGILLMLINIMLLIAGVFLETTAALILLTPILVNVLPSLGVDIIQLGVIVVTNLAIGMLTPPLGICLIVSSGIAGCRMEDMVHRILPMLLILLVDLMIITYWPPLTLFFPDLLNY